MDSVTYIACKFKAVPPPMQIYIMFCSIPEWDPSEREMAERLKEEQCVINLEKCFHLVVENRCLRWGVPFELSVVSLRRNVRAGPLKKNGRPELEMRGGQGGTGLWIKSTVCSL